MLQREYDMVKREIEQRQREYIEGRSLYMEEIMVSHQHDMSQFMLHRRSNSRDSLEHVDKQFLKKYKKVKFKNVKTKTHECPFKSFILSNS